MSPRKPPHADSPRKCRFLPWEGPRSFLKLHLWEQDEGDRHVHHFRTGSQNACHGVLERPQGGEEQQLILRVLVCSPGSLELNSHSPECQDPPKLVSLLLQVRS